ncbi:enoyl-CoA hydratase/isomerase family protein [Motiliproteus sp. MSK22-1]|uniref:enoyl-CoA hydratase/isomerase family protein n=1 Tax=Motiliproteus sp. MSK22-1 TaxID=1897630 RepID=UPI000975D216|nr:enoyl-CoA hydratase/isomerase family protein [Motiliproteus sp. MSK22-1]OMH29435.1 enoyl-CoA hydratase [Motiliproteus sp. MSK22-1]
MNTGQVTVNCENHIAEILVDRPEKLNALTVEMLDALYDVVLKLDEDSLTRVVILRTGGERAFCVGADIHAWAQYSPLDMWRTWVKRGHRVFDALAGLRQPVIAVIQGPALGGGFELAMAADLRIADEQAHFGLPETGIATCPGWSGSYRLGNVINSSLIKEMVLTGRVFSSHRAYVHGLVNEVADAGKALQQARFMAQQIATRAPVSVQLSKQMIDAGSGENTGMIIESMASGLSALTNDAKEGVSAFREKRQPNFNGE